MFSKTKTLLKSTVDITYTDSKEMIYDKLTNEEIEDGYFIDPIYGMCNMKKALGDINEEIRREYEAFDLMHKCDGTFSKFNTSL